jgi:hypothetical protein
MTPNDDDIDKLAKLSMWTVYAHPLAPQGFAARRWITGRGRPTLSGDAFFGETLDEVRGFLTQHYPGLVCLARSAIDDPAIVETWI